MRVSSVKSNISKFVVIAIKQKRPSSEINLTNIIIYRP